MKVLYIVRHAKSSWDHPGLPDYKRPLIKSGVVRTEKIIDHLKSQQANPGLIISSHAVRARETAVMIAAGLSYPESSIRIEEKIYSGNEDDILDMIFGIDNNIDQLMLVGHNPTFTSLASSFLNTPMDWLPTSGVVCIEFKTDKWENILLVKKRTKFVTFPKHLRDGMKGSK